MENVSGDVKLYIKDCSNYQKTSTFNEISTGLKRPRGVRQPGPQRPKWSWRPPSLGGVLVGEEFNGSTYMATYAPGSMQARRGYTVSNERQEQVGLVHFVLVGVETVSGARKFLCAR